MGVAEGVDMTGKDDKVVKTTVLLPKRVNGALDVIAKRELTGSKGRTIEWLVRFYDEHRRFP